MLRMKKISFIMVFSTLCPLAFGLAYSGHDARGNVAAQKSETGHATTSMPVAPLTQMPNERGNQQQLDDREFSNWDHFLPGHYPPDLLVLLKKMKLAVMNGDRDRMAELVAFPVIADYNGSSVRVNRQKFLNLYDSLFTYNMKSMILRSNLANIHEDMSGDTWGLFAGYGDIWVSRKSKEAPIKITRIDTEKAPIYLASAANAKSPNINEDRAYIESFLEGIRSADDKSSISIIGSSLVIPVVLCDHDKVRVLSSHELRLEDKAKLVQLLRNENLPEKITLDCKASPYSVYRVEFDKATVYMEIVSDLDDKQGAQMKVQVFRIDWR